MVALRCTNSMARQSLQLKYRRAVRFEIGLPLRYCLVGERRWHPARTYNISKSGVLFVAPAPVSVNAKLQIEVTLTSGADQPPGAVVCVGTVVRQGPSCSGNHVVAARIAHAQLVPALALRKANMEEFLKRSDSTDL